MTTPAVSSMVSLPGVITREREAPARRKYRTTASFAAVHFDHTEKGEIVVLPQGAEVRVTGPSSCLPGGFEVVFKKEIYNVFEIDLMNRSVLIFETVKAKRRDLAACA
jgi:hypothetical protein